MHRDGRDSLGTRSLPPEAVRPVLSSMADDARRGNASMQYSSPEIISPAAVSVESFFGDSDSDADDGHTFQNTLAIIKPEAAHLMYKIESLMEQNGFIVITKDVVRLTREQASEFYSGHTFELYFPRLVDHMSSGPIVVYVLAKRNCVEEWRRMIGPASVSYAKRYFPVSLRGVYGTEEGNAFHGSDTLSAAEREIRFFFPNVQLESMNESAEDMVRYIQEEIMPTITEGLSVMFETNPSNRLRWFGNWLLLKNVKGTDE